MQFHRIGDVTVLNDSAPVPGFGGPPLFLPVNAFVLHAEQPIAVGDEVRDLQLLWASIDSPWVHNIDPTRFRATVDPLRAMGASAVFSSHLPPVQQPDDLDGS